MALFSFGDLAQPESISNGLTTTRVQAKSVDFRLENELKKLDSLTMGDVLAVGSKGSVSMYQLVEKLLSLTGTAELTFATWAISQKPTEALERWRNTGMVSSIEAVLDVRLKERKPAQYAYIAGFALVKSAKCHAKVAIIQNEKWSVAVVGSANWTRNPRMEAYVILADVQAASELKAWTRNP